MALFWKNLEDLLVQDSMYFEILVLRLGGAYDKNDKSFEFFWFLVHLVSKTSITLMCHKVG